MNRDEPEGGSLRANEGDSKIAAGGPLQRSHILTGASTKGKPVERPGRKATDLLGSDPAGGGTRRRDTVKNANRG